VRSVSADIVGYCRKSQLTFWSGIFTSGTNHFAHAGKPAFLDIAAEYMNGPLQGADSIMMERVNESFPKDASPQLVADAITEAIDAPRGEKPLRIAVDPFQDGSDEIMTLADQKHVEFLRRCGIYDICSFDASKTGQGRV
jgi:hypothetical protein